MVGIEIIGDPVMDMLTFQPMVAGNGSPIAGRTDRGRMTERPIAIDDKARHPRQNRRRPQTGGQPPRHRRGADIPSDMAVQGFVRQPQIGQTAGHQIAGVIADDQRSSDGPGSEHFDRETRQVVFAEWLCFFEAGKRQSKKVSINWLWIIVISA